VKFIGERGSFTINFSDENKMVSSHFNIDGKKGQVKTYPDKGAGTIFFGTYAQDGVPSFVGTWDLISFGAPEPFHPGFFLIEDIFIFHKGTHHLTDTTGGLFEPFEDFCVVGGPFDGGAIDPTGGAIVAFDQIATIAGFEGHWFMYSPFPGVGLDPFTCAPLPPGIDGFWDWGSKSGTLTRLFP
ncbi:MAG: hypothetical protein KUG68_03860, partial [Flavobacteriaceae bacterium]|nr:hypothetical protein [Flavobacteriaceae bacterium]